LWAGGRAGSVAATGRDSEGVNQTDARRPLAAAFIHGAAAGMHCDICPWYGGSGVEHDPLVGLMLTGQQSWPRPGAIIRRQRGNSF